MSEWRAGSRWCGKHSLSHIRASLQHWHSLYCAVTLDALDGDWSTRAGKTYWIRPNTINARKLRCQCIMWVMQFERWRERDRERQKNCVANAIIIYDFQIEKADNGCRPARQTRRMSIRLTIISTIIIDFICRKLVHVLSRFAVSTDFNNNNGTCVKRSHSMYKCSVAICWSTFALLLLLTVDKAIRYNCRNYGQSNAYRLQRVPSQHSQPLRTGLNLSRLFFYCFIFYTLFIGQSMFNYLSIQLFRISKQVTAQAHCTQNAPGEHLY